MLLKAVILQFEMLIIVNDYGGYEVPQSAIYMLEKQETQWCNSVWVQRPENRAMRGGQ